MNADSNGGWVNICMFLVQEAHYVSLYSISESKKFGFPFLTCHSFVHSKLSHLSVVHLRIFAT